MKNNHVLIDYENVQPKVADILAQPIFKVLVFVGAQQNKVSYDLLDLIQRKGADARSIKVPATGRNALDFHMAFYAGRLAEREPDGYFHLTAKDTGMDPLVKHLQAEGMHVFRWENVTDIPIAKMRPDVAEDDKLSRVIEYLARRGPQRPGSLKTLRGSVAALFDPKLNDAQTDALIQQLQAQGVVETSQAKMKYGLPD